MQYKEQGSKKSADELVSDRDLVDTEISAMMEYFANLNDMCVVNVMQCEEERLRHVTVTAEPEETLSIQSESGRKGGCACSSHILGCLSEAWVWRSPRYESAWFARPR